MWMYEVRYRGVSSWILASRSTAYTWVASLYPRDKSGAGRVRNIRPIFRLKIWTERLKVAIAAFNLSVQIFSLIMGLFFWAHGIPCLTHWSSSIFIFAAVR